MALDTTYDLCNICGEEMGPDKLHIVIDNGHVARHTYAHRRHRYVMVTPPGQAVNGIHTQVQQRTDYQDLIQKRRFDTEKPVRPALGRAPRPVAPSSRISPPAPVAAPAKGEIAVGWLCVSTFISTCEVSALASYTGALVKPRGAQRSMGPPCITAALSL